VSGGKWASGARGSKGARTCGGHRSTCGRGHVHDKGRGWKVGDGLTDGVRGIEREQALGREERRRQDWPTGQREGEGERARGLAPTGGTRLSGTKGARARARGSGLNGPAWAELGFSIFREFLISFLFIFSRVFNSNPNQVSNSN
jgi:hypothetical protein